MPDCKDCEGRCPELLPGNNEAFELLMAGSTQMRVGGMGSVIGYDYNALALLANTMCIDLTPAIWRKVRAVETVIRRMAKEEAERQKRS